MDLMEEKQAHLIAINNLCACFSVTIEKHYGTPDAAELLGIINRLAKKCGEYLRIYPT